MQMQQMRTPYGGSAQLAVGGLKPATAALGGAHRPAQANLAGYGRGGGVHAGMSATASQTTSHRGSGRSTPDGGSHLYSRVQRPSSPPGLPGSVPAGANSPSNWRFPTLSPARGTAIVPKANNLNKDNSGSNAGSMSESLDASAKGFPTVSLDATTKGLPPGVNMSATSPTAAAMSASSTPVLNSSSKVSVSSRASSHDRGPLPVGKRSQSPVKPVAQAAVASPRNSANQFGLSAVHRDFDKQVEAMRGAFEQSMAALREGPRLQLPQQEVPTNNHLGLATALFAAASALNHETAKGNGGGSGAATPVARPPESLKLAGMPGGSDGGSGGCAGGNNADGRHEVFSILMALQRNIEQQQGAQQAALASLTGQWEQRFAALEQAVNNGLALATSTAASMNERSGKFLRLGEVLEGALDRIVDDGKDMATLSQTVHNTQRDIERLNQEAVDERMDRRKAIMHISQQAEAQVSSLRERVELLLQTGVSGGVGLNMAAYRPDSKAIEQLQGQVARMQQQLLEENTERRQLAKELQFNAADANKLKEKFDAVQDQILRLNRDLNASRDEVRQLSTSETTLVGALAGAVAKANEKNTDLTQRLDTLGQQLNMELFPKVTAKVESAGDDIDTMRKRIAAEIVAATKETAGTSPQPTLAASAAQKRSSTFSKGKQPAGYSRPAPIPEEE